MLSYKESLKILKETDALLEGHFILSSGLHSDQYVQCAKLFSFIISEHSNTDLPVVITSSTIRIFEFFGISNPLLKINCALDLSAKIVFIFNCLPISYPTTIPPIAGDKIMSILLKFFLIFSHKEEHII